MKRRPTQRGAALLLAMLMVTLVAVLASASLWQQWRAIEVERAQRVRLQAGWLLTGALDWSRLILREDGRANQLAGQPDHLGEPWALPLQEARLSRFLALDANERGDELLEAFFSGEIIDLQSRLNFGNLVRQSGSGNDLKADISPVDLEAFRRLYARLGLPAGELEAAAQAWRQTLQQALTDPRPSATALIPQRFAQLRWLGISSASLAVLEPHATLLPGRTPLNLNTASAEALEAAIPGIDATQARALVQARGRQPLLTLAEARRALFGDRTPEGSPLSEVYHDVRSRHFEIRGRLRLDDLTIEERSVVQRSNQGVRVLWRERFSRD